MDQIRTGILLMFICITASWVCTSAGATSETKPTDATAGTNPATEKQPTVATDGTQPTQATGGTQPTVATGGTQPTEAGGDTSAATSSVATTVTPEATTFTPTPSTTPAPDLKPRLPDIENIQDLEVPFDFSIKFNEPFEADLWNTSSQLYQDMKKNITEKLHRIFNASSGFKEIKFLSFSNGSILTSYQVMYGKLEVLKNMSGLVEYFKDQAIPNMKTSFGEYQVDIGYINDTVHKEVNEAKWKGLLLRTNICKDHEGSICKRYEDCEPVDLPQFPHGAYCRNKCHKNVCTDDNGRCTLSWDMKPKCSCKEGYILEGSDTCVKRLDKSFILGMSLGFGIPIVLGLILVIAYLANKLKQKEEKQNYNQWSHVHYDNTAFADENQPSVMHGGNIYEGLTTKTNSSKPRTEL